MCTMCDQLLFSLIQAVDASQESYDKQLNYHRKAQYLNFGGAFCVIGSFILFFLGLTVGIFAVSMYSHW